MEDNLERQMISCLAVSPGFPTDRLCFAATDTGLLVSNDGGDTWKNGLASLYEDPVAITAVLCVPQSSGIPLVLAGFSGGVLRSEDGGGAWQVVLLGTPPPVVTALAVSRDRLLYAGTAEDGVFVSKDDGRSWVRWNFGLLDCHIFSLATLQQPDGCQKIFAGVESGLFSSTSGGRTWREVDFPMDEGVVLALRAGEGQQVFAGTETGALFRSSDGGVSWAKVGIDVFDGEISSILVAGSGAAPDVLVACGERLLISRDGGETWRDWNNRVPLDVTILTLAAPDGLAPGSIVFAAGSGGIVYQIPGL